MEVSHLSSRAILKRSKSFPTADSETSDGNSAERESKTSDNENFDIRIRHFHGKFPTAIRCRKPFREVEKHTNIVFY